MITSATSSKIANWYMKGQYVPSLGSVQFTKFAAHGFSFIRELNPRAEINYRIDPLATSASWDLIDKTITLPGFYFIPDGVKPFASEATGQDALALINGSTIHESLHAKLTPWTMDAMMTAVRAHLEYPVSAQLIAAIANIVEDVYIEGFRDLENYHTAWLNAKNNLLFNNASWEKFIETFDPKSVPDLVNALTFWKRTALRIELPKFLGTEIVSELSRLATMAANKIEFRMAIAGNIVRLILENADKAESESSEGKGESSESGEGDESEGESESSETSEPTSSPSTSSKGTKKSDPMDNSGQPDAAEGPHGEDLESVKSAVEAEREKLEKLVKAFNAEIKKELSALDKEKEVKDAGKAYKNLENALKVSDVKDVSTGAGSLMNIQLSNRFTTLLKQMRTVLPVRGRGKENGARIDPLRLHQVAVDGKIFAQRTIEQTGQNDKVEIIILVDASGSMNSNIPDGSGETLYSKTVAVTHKIFKALLSSNIMTKAFAHTSSYSYLGISNAPHLIKIAENNTANFTRKFELALGISLNQNLDGIIINEIVKNQFKSDSRTQKVLLVLSDGSPQSPNYEGAKAIRHTMTAIENARKAGVKVFSLSLTDDVNRRNSAIYGEDYNVDASKDLDGQMTKLVTMLVRRK